MGFDVSSSVIGWSVLNIDEQNEIKLFQSGFFKPPKNGNIFENLLETKEHIIELLQEFKPNKVAIEEITQYMPHFSSAKTIIKLALYNRLVGLTVFETLKITPELCNVMSIRHGIKKSKSLPKKEEIPELVETILGITLPVKYSRNGSIKTELYDEADAIACGLYYCYKLVNKTRQ